MMKIFGIAALLLMISAGAFAQAKPRPTPKKIPSSVPVKPGTTPTPVGAKSSVDAGTVSGRTYTNKTFGFEVTFPDTWLIPDSDFEEYMKKQGFDLSIKTPKNVSMLLTAYSSMPGSADIAVARISVEDLSTNPQIKDAVDYFDAVRAAFAAMKLPPDFTYSETHAEKLGATQFAFLDTSAKEGKKRMYATVRGGHAIMFTLSYTNDDDLQTMRKVLEEGNFALK